MRAAGVKRMRIFGFNISRQALAQPSVQRSLASAVWRESDGSTRLSNAYQQCVWVYRAVNALAEQVANMPFRFSLRAEPQTLMDRGDLVDFYERPHPRLNRFQYWELRVVWLMLRGECMRVPQYDSRGRLEKVLIPDPGKFEHIVENGELVGWRYRDWGTTAPLASQVFLPEEVLHERLPNPFDPWRGMPPLALAAGAAATDHASGNFVRGLMENNGEPALVVTTKEQLDPEQREQLLAACAERRRGAGKPHRPLLLWGGCEVVMPKLTGADADFLATRRFSRAEICAAFGVPEEVITSSDNLKYDVMAGTRLNFVENRVVPLCRRLEAEEQRLVSMADPKAVGWFDVEDHPVMNEARRGRLAAAKAAFELGVPLNEVNKSLNLGFPEYSWGNVGYVPTTLTEAGRP